MKALNDEIKNALKSNIYILFGEEQYLVNEYVEKMKNIVVDENSPMKMMNFDIFEGEKSSTLDIFNAFTTLSFSNDRRFVLVKDSGLFFKGRADDTLKMLEYLEDLSPDCVLVFAENKVDKRGKLYKYILKVGKVFELNKLDEKSLSNWIIKKTNDENLEIDTKTSTYLARILNFDMTNIFSQLNKVIDYKKNGEITILDIDTIVSKPLETKIFELIEAISLQKCEKALSIYNNMVLMKESPLLILTMIGRQFRLILECKVMILAHSSSDEIGKSIGVHPYVIKQCILQSKNFSKRALYSAFEDVVETDIKIKTGLVSDVLGVELIIIKYSNLQSL